MTAQGYWEQWKGNWGTQCNTSSMCLMEKVETIKNLTAMQINKIFWGRVNMACEVLLHDLRQLLERNKISCTWAGSCSYNLHALPKALTDILLSFPPKTSEQQKGGFVWINNYLKVGRKD